MRRNLSHRLRAVGLLAGAFLLAPAMAWAEARFAPPGQGAQASIDFRIIVPPVVRLLANEHPLHLDRDAAGRWSGQQTLVLLTNLKRGACLTLRAAGRSPAAAWRTHAVLGPALLQPAGDGWRVCTSGPGRHTLTLRHEFDPSAGDAPGESDELRAWPVTTELVTL